MIEKVKICGSSSSAFGGLIGFEIVKNKSQVSLAFVFIEFGKLIFFPPKSGLLGG
jgi:hypothetical protein